MRLPVEENHIRYFVIWCAYPTLLSFMSMLQFRQTKGGWGGLYAVQMSFDSSQDVLRAKDRKMSQMQTELATQAAMIASLEQQVKGADPFDLCMIT